MDIVRLKTFQPLDRITKWQANEPLMGDWDKVGGSLVIPAYRAMLQRMAAHGIACSDRPPIWAWRGLVTLQVARDCSTRSTNCVTDGPP